MTYLNAAAGAARESARSTEASTVFTALPVAAVADIAGTTPAGGTGATAGAYDTANNRDALIATVAELKSKVNTLLARLRTAGVVAP